MQRPVPIPSDMLLAHAGALRALAKRILGDAEAAEDVVQETWVAALERPPARRERISGWLGAVARTLAWKRLRSEERRRTREETAARPIRVDPAAETAARRQALRRMTDAVLELAEPYQTVVLLRFFDGLPPRTIAAQLGVPVATVKSRIARGLALLRERLERDLRADGTTLHRAMAFLVGPALPVAPWPSLDSTGGGGLSNTGAGSAAASAGAGLVFMGVQVKVAAAVFATCAVGLIAWQGLGGRAVEPTGPKARGEDAAARPLATLENFGAAPQAANTAEDRQVVTEGFARVFADETEDVITDPFWFTLEGTVVGWDDFPVEGAELMAGPLGHPMNQGITTDQEGHFAMSWPGRAPSMELVYGVRGPHGGWSGYERLRLSAGTTRVAVSLRPQTRQVVRLAFESLATSLDLSSADDGESGDGIVLRYASAQVDNGPGQAIDFLCDEEGRGSFALRHAGGCPGQFNLLYQDAFAHQSLLRLETIRIANNAVTLRAFQDYTVVLGHEPVASPKATFSGIVRDALGEPVVGALMALSSVPGLGDGPRTSTGTDGTFLMEDVPEGTWFVRAGGVDDGRAETSFVAAIGHDERYEAWLHRGNELVGRLVTPEGVPLAGWEVDVRCADPLLADYTSTDKEGRFSIPNLPNRPIDMVVRSGESAGAPGIVIAGVLPQGGEGRDFEIRAEDAAPAGAVLRVEDEDGDVAAAATVRLWHLASGRAVVMSLEDETFTHPRTLPPGAYEIEVVSPLRESVRLGPVHLAGGEITPLGTIPLAPRGQMRIAGEATSDLVRERWTSRIWQLRDDTRSLVIEVAGHFAPKLDLPAGFYELELTPNEEHEDIKRRVEREAELPAARRIAFEVIRDERTRLGVQLAADGAIAALLPPELEKPKPKLTAAQLEASRIAFLQEGFKLRMAGGMGSCSSCH